MIRRIGRTAAVAVATVLVVMSGACGGSDESDGEAVVRSVINALTSCNASAIESDALPRMTDEVRFQLAGPEASARRVADLARECEQRGLRLERVTAQGKDADGRRRWRATIADKHGETVGDDLFVVVGEGEEAKVGLPSE